MSKQVKKEKVNSELTKKIEIARARYQSCKCNECKKVLKNLLKRRNKC